MLQGTQTALEALWAKMYRGRMHELTVEDELRVLVCEGYDLFTLSLRIHLDSQSQVSRTETMQGESILKIIHTPPLQKVDTSYPIP